jgi:hypothetical protein
MKCPCIKRVFVVIVVQRATQYERRVMSHTKCCLLGWKFVATLRSDQSVNLSQRLVIDIHRTSLNFVAGVRFLNVFQAQEWCSLSVHWSVHISLHMHRQLRTCALRYGHNHNIYLFTIYLFTTYFTHLFLVLLTTLFLVYIREKTAVKWPVSYLKERR